MHDTGAPPAAAERSYSAYPAVATTTEELPVLRGASAASTVTAPKQGTSYHTASGDYLFTYRTVLQLLYKSDTLRYL